MCFAFLDDTSGSESSPEREARQLIKKIRRHIRLLNRKWTELNQGSNEWQARLDEVLEVPVLRERDLLYLDSDILSQAILCLFTVLQYK